MLKTDLERLDLEKQKDNIKNIPILLVEDNYIAQRAQNLS